MMRASFKWILPLWAAVGLMLGFASSLEAGDGTNAPGLDPLALQFQVVKNLSEKAPFIVNVMDTLEIHTCVGVLVSPLAVLVPASCIRPGFPVVRVMSSNVNGEGPAEEQEKRTVCKKIIHANFTGRIEGNNNIALLILGGNTSTPVDRIPGLKSLVDCPDGKIQMFGWFAPTYNSGPSEDLKVVDVKPIKREDCEKNFTGLSSGSVCLETELAQGMTWSLGAVLTCQKTDVIGMMTHTLPGVPSPNARLPYVFTSAWAHRDWIQSLGGERSIVLNNEVDAECRSIDVDSAQSCKAGVEGTG